VKLLLDENLSIRVLGDITDLYPESSHVSLLGLTRTDDSIIWNRARAEHFCIVSKDSDFHQRSLLFGAPPKVVFLKVGNCTTAKILSVLRDNHHVISKFQEDQDASLLILG
jgi:predicted nuclease of predicted toxin-antitoxin system